MLPEAPAAHVARGEQSAGVIAARGDLDDLAADVDVPRDGGYVVAEALGAVPQLTRRSRAPAAYVARVEQRAGVEAARADLDDLAADIDVVRRGGRLVVTDVLFVRALPELVGPVVPPAAHLARVVHRADVSATHADRNALGRRRQSRVFAGPSLTAGPCLTAGASLATDTARRVAR